ncbi:NAD-dependent epimerase/dehydratase family protein [Microvirga roseola]|uniref:NAD-dependent epimerase/dehydratase family protein n=1 Tax=Microvirga roseola TaxID=2883126 RepID=UPI001E3803F7|nr:SDR family oxidoreductase [Microvirga roseola]
MTTSKKILITGNKGYIGSVMAPWFQAQGYDVVGLDTDYYEGCTLVPELADIPTIRKDIRDVTPDDIQGVDAIIHLAALSNDPIGNLNEEWTSDINGKATIRLAEIAKDAGIRRFIFSSSCIMYGMSEASVVDETSPLAPQTVYARSKVEAEESLTQLADDNFSPTLCRNGTIYGLSPRMRFDTVLNNLMGIAFTKGRVTIHSDGTPWRPVVHVQDVSRAFQAILEAPLEDVHNQAFNVGANELNHQVRDLAEIVLRTVPNCEIVMDPHPGADQRTYKADFSKFARTFPEFRFLWNAEKGAQELYETFRKAGLTYEDYVDKRFTRLKWLQHLMDDGLINDELRWTQSAAPEGMKPAVAAE